MSGRLSKSRLRSPSGGMFAADTLADSFFLAAYTGSRDIPAPNVNVLRSGQLVPKVFSLHCQINVALCPQGRRALSANYEGKVRLGCCFGCVQDQIMRTGDIQGDI